MKVQSVFFLAVLIIATESKADGFTDITAKQSNGDTIIFVTDPPAYVMVKHPNDEFTEYKNEGCEYKHIELNGKNSLEISCPSGGKSPLAGVKYSGAYTLGNCEKVPMAIYTCVSGCGKQVPKKMEQAWWECGD